MLGCGGDSEPLRTPGHDGNLLINPGFEDGKDPWVTLHPESGFSVSSDVAHSGLYSSELRMLDPSSAAGDKIYDVTQEFNVESIPEVVRGWYYAKSWIKNTPRQYLQVAFVVFRPRTPVGGGAETSQVRYILGGIDSPPYSFSNSRYVFISREQPEIGKWVAFELPVREDLEQLLGEVPTDFTNVRILFEVRWDGKTSGDGEARAEVYYDDLYAGAR